ncbi:MAG: response regulator [Ghiorsea sp.]
MTDEKVKNALQSLFEQGRDPMFITDERGHMIRVNDAFNTLYQFEDVVGKSLNILFQKPLYDAVGYKKVLKTLLKEGRWSGELHVIAENGEIIPVWTQIIGVEQGFSAIQVDLRERDKMTRKMEGLSRLQSVATLAGGVAHEFNNILAGIQGHLYLFKRQLPDSAVKDKERFNRIDGLMHRAGSLVQNLLAFSKQKSTVTHQVSMPQLLEETIEMIKKALDKKINLSLNIQGQDLNVHVDPVILKQHIFELVSNAEAAILRQRHDQNYQGDGSGHIDVQLKLSQENQVELMIRDNGVGMQDATLQHCLDPFFTTAPVGQGTGLGLSSAMAYMQDMKGSLDVESTFGEYTCIIVQLPLATDVQEKTAINGQVLLVDDDDDLRISIEEVLTYHGYEVLTANNGLEALDLWRANQDTLGAVVMDIIMPKMDGLEVAQEIRKTHANLPVCLTTGYSHQRIPSSLHVNLLRKPLDPDLLIEFLDLSTH